MWMYSRSNGPSVKRPPTGISVIGSLVPFRLLGDLGLQHGRRERRGIDRHLQAGPQLRHGADVVLVGVRQHEPEKIGALLLDETQVGQHDIDARLELAGKGDAEIDHDPFARLRGTVPVEIDVHADFAGAPQGQEDELWRL